MFRFTIRDVLWLMVVMGLSLGWYLHYERLTRPSKLYRDDEIVARHKFYIDGFYGPIAPGQEQGVVPQGKSMSLSEIFKTLGIDPRRLTDFRHVQYNRSITLCWQISPSYDLVCTTLDEGGTLAFDDPNREIFVAHIQLREDQREEEPPAVLPPVSGKAERSDTTTHGTEL
jgi:hypothetical protein